MATKRTSTSRSRNGCKTCKIRHVRCDETIPACLRCTSTGRMCDGYLSSPKSGPDDTPQKTFQASAETSTSLQLPHMVTPIYSLPFKVPGSQKERQILHYYCVQAALDLSGYMNPAFWTQSLLCTSHHEPVVRQALVALSSIKLFFESEPRDGRDGKVSFSPEVQAQYIKALRRLRKYIATNSKPSKTVVLQCCILFYCFEGARGDQEAALQHLGNAFSILQNGFSQEETLGGKDADSCLGADSHAGPDEELDEIREILVRLDLQATLYANYRVPLFQAKSAMSGKQMEFATLSQARSSLDRLMTQFASFLIRNVEYREVSFSDIPISTLEGKHGFDLQLQDWKRAYDTFCKELTTKKSEIPEEDQNRGLQLLEIHHHTLQLCIKSTFPNDPTIFGGSPNPPVEEILRKAENLITSSEKHGRHRRIFSAETGTIAFLFIIAMKVTDPTLFLRTVQLLLSCNRREGLYDSKMIAQIVLEIQRARKNARQDGGLVNMLDYDGWDRVYASDNLEEEFSYLVSSNVALKSTVDDIADLPGGVRTIVWILGVGTMAKLLGVDHGN